MPPGANHPCNVGKVPSPSQASDFSSVKWEKEAFDDGHLHISKFLCSSFAVLRPWMRPGPCLSVLPDFCSGAQISGKGLNLPSVPHICSSGWGCLLGMWQPAGPTSRVGPSCQPSRTQRSSGKLASAMPCTGSSSSWLSRRWCR